VNSDDSSRGRRRRRPRGGRRLGAMVAGAAVAALGMVPLAQATTAAAPAPGQRTDLKVLLIGATGDEPAFGGWKAALAREGVPYDALVADSAPDLTDATLADYGANHARYEAVVLATGDLVHAVTSGATTTYPSALSDAEWATLAKYEKTFGIRQISDDTFPSPAHGLNYPTSSGDQSGQTGTLTTAGKLAFPYLKGTVAIDQGSFGYQAAPVSATDFSTLLSGPGGAAYLGVYTHPDDGREEMVMTVDGNQNQTHVQLLRHGMLDWATRGVFLGTQRNYLELQVDDVFLGDDAWDPATHTTDYDPAKASRMTSRDVARAVAWEKQTGLRLDMVYNGGGSELFKAEQNAATDPLLTALQADKGAFGWINHTYDHPNLDCSTQAFIAKEITDNTAWAKAAGLPVTDPGELVTGEHSGLANTRPGNPGTIDPPELAAVGAGTPAGTLAAGSYEYGVSAVSPHGQTPASTSQTTVAAGRSVATSWQAVCHATGYRVYRRPSGGSWSLIGTVAQPAGAFTDAGPAAVSFTDTGAKGTTQAPPAANGATLDPYAQNPNLTGALGAAGVKALATDASKAYPQDPLSLSGAQFAAGEAFADGPARTLPRYPTNIYYNASKQKQQLDEYNWIYTDPVGGGGCTPIAGVTTCNGAPASWAAYVASEDRIMFSHMMGNDPRPHYVHQSNLADYDPALPETDPNQGATLYPVVDGLLDAYGKAFDRTSMPLVQLTHTQATDELARQAAWRKAVAAGEVTGYLQDGQVHLASTAAGAVPVPVTGTSVGSRYGGDVSGWTTLGAGASDSLPVPGAALNATMPPAVSGSAVVGQVLTATTGAWTGTAPVTTTSQWQRCDASGASCAAIAGATGAAYTLTAADAGATLRVLVSATDATGAKGQAASAVTATVKAAALTASPGPSVSGATTVGATLTAAPGAWSGAAPLTYAYQWQRCSATGANCAGVAGATRATYVLAAADAGATLRVSVTAKDAAGATGQAASAVTAVVVAPAVAPANTALPAITGTARVGRTLTAGTGTWTGTAPIAFAYQWQRCPLLGGTCRDVAGATTSTYAVKSLDTLSRLRVVVTAKNAAGARSATSALTSAVF
jgi:hypothetical protein